MNFWSLFKKPATSKGVFDVTTIGSATRDVFLKSKDIQTIKSDDFQTGQGLCVGAGSKVNIEEIYFTTGGSAVNSAVTFAQQGLRTAIFCKVGNDLRGHAIKERLAQTGVAQDFILTDSSSGTAYSAIMHAPSGERSIFAYRGLSAQITKKEFDFNILRYTKWIFMSHLGGTSADLFSPILVECHKRGVRVALNPGPTQLALGHALIPHLKHIDILFVNQEEASMLTGVDFQKEEELFAKLDTWVTGTAVMTKGKDGVSVSDGKTRWDAPALKEPKFVDRTGAGDAFASGFTAAMIKGLFVEDAIRLASANATALLGEWGANSGLLSSNDSVDKFGRLEIEKNILHKIAR